MKILWDGAVVINACMYALRCIHQNAANARVHCDISTIGQSLLTIYVAIDILWDSHVLSLITVFCATQRSKASGYVSWSDIVYKKSAETEAMHNPGCLGEDIVIFHWHLRPALAFKYNRCLRLSVCSYVRQSRTCPRDNLSSVQVRISKYGTKV